MLRREIFDADDVLYQLWAVQAVVKLPNGYPPHRVAAACRRASFYGVTNYAGVKRILVQGLDLEVPKGELLCIMGPSGSGKSTLLHLLGGIDRADEGTVRVGGVELTGLSESKLCQFRAANRSFVFQSFNLVPVLTEAAHVDLPLRLLPMSATRLR